MRRRSPPGGGGERLTVDDRPAMRRGAAERSHKAAETTSGPLSSVEGSKSKGEINFKTSSPVCSVLVGGCGVRGGVGGRRRRGVQAARRRLRPCGVGVRAVRRRRVAGVQAASPLGHHTAKEARAEVSHLDIISDPGIRKPIEDYPPAMDAAEGGGGGRGWGDAVVALPSTSAAAMEG
uniref:Uncharacterized protein n=1 Tax=Oryza sativa subsp. japonica TaxID=39947 RepID=Q5VMA8_ORYSJ|nr:hypothetical protein [Oryza sativa Japonica Group]BAD69417.1 hypothetical protein [Oryza sativa Japonica Group]